MQTLVVNVDDGTVIEQNHCFFAKIFADEMAKFIAVFVDGHSIIRLCTVKLCF